LGGRSDLVGTGLLRHVLRHLAERYLLRHTAQPHGSGVLKNLTASQNNDRLGFYFEWFF
jgi:hypothetical protein